MYVLLFRQVVMSYGGLTLSTEEAEEMILSADVDGDGQVNYEEFLDLFNSSQGKIHQANSKSSSSKI